MKTIVAVFDQRHAAVRAIRELVTRGVAQGRISFISQADASETGSTQLRLDDDAPEHREATSPSEPAAPFPAASGLAADSTNPRPTEGTASTVALGSMILAAAFMSLPAVGPVLAAGPLVTGIAAGGAQASGRDLPPSLHRSGVPPHDAERYVDAVRRGHALVVVTAGEDEVEDVARALARHSPIEA